MFYTVKSKRHVTHHCLRRYCFMELNFFVLIKTKFFELPLSIKVKLIENVIVENRYFEQKITINHFYMKLHLLNYKVGLSIW